MRSVTRVLRAASMLTAVVLVAATACEKSKPAINPTEAIVPAGAAALDLAGDPQILFQVFGEHESPHMMPIAAVVKGVVKPIGLTLAGWKQLDSHYMTPGTKYPFYVEGSEPGDMTVVHDTTYSLPGCGSVKPMAVVQLAFRKPHPDPTVEFLASSKPLPQPHLEAGKLMTSAEIEKLARGIGHAVGKRANLSPAELDSLDFHARMIPTGTSRAPTLLISFMDPNAGSSRSGKWASHVFALADSGANGYEATYSHAVKGDAATVEFQRLVNHVDVNGDGTDEIIVEAWKYASDSDLIVLTFRAGKWQEVLRVKQNWCLDAPKEK